MSQNGVQYRIFGEPHYYIFEKGFPIQIKLWCKHTSISTSKLELLSQFRDPSWGLCKYKRPVPAWGLSTCNWPVSSGSLQIRLASTFWELNTPSIRWYSRSLHVYLCESGPSQRLRWYKWSFPYLRRYKWLHQTYLDKSGRNIPTSIQAFDIPKSFTEWIYSLVLNVFYNRREINFRAITL